MTLLIVVDMQNDFVTGALGTAEAQAIVPHVNAKIAAADAVVYTLDTHGEDYLATQEGKRLPVPHCIRGTWGHALAEGKPCLLRFGKMESGSARNAVSDHTHLEGSLRCLDDGLYAALWEQAQAIGRAVGEETGCTVTMTCSSGYPPVTNDAALLAEVRERFPIAEAETTCITEDFSEYQRHAPGVFFFLGTGGIELHAPTFTFPEEILDKGEALLCGLV